jgi:hypothetical protein
MWGVSSVAGPCGKDLQSLAGTDAIGTNDSVPGSVSPRVLREVIRLDGDLKTLAREGLA